MKGPFVIPALLLIVGILLGDRVSAPLGLLFGASLGLAVACLAEARFLERWLWLLIVFFGWTNLASRTAVVSPHDVRRVLEPRHEFVELRGTLAATPRQLISERDGAEFRHSLALLDLSRIERGQEGEAATGRVVVHTPGWLGKEFFAEREVSVRGVIGPPKGPVAEGLFDYPGYLRRRGIHFTVDAEAAQDWRVTTEAGGEMRRPLADRFQDWARATLARGLPEDDRSVRLVWAMTLGWRTALTDEVARPFMRSGTIHLFAVSGLHVAMISGILVAALRAFSVPRAACGAVAIPSLIFFCAVTGHHASTVRATIMMSIVIAGWSLKRPVDLVNSLAGAAFIILAWEPRQLFHAGFQLSFFVVLGIALALPRFEQWRERLLGHDPLLPPELRPSWQRRLDGPTRWLGINLATSLAAWLGSAPLVAEYFHLFTPVSLLANLLIVPLAAPTLAACLASLACEPVAPFLSELFNHAAWLSMSLMVRLSEWAADLPGAWFNVASPPFAAVAFWYALLFGGLNADRLPGARQRAWALAGAVGALCALVFILVPSRSTRLTALALRGGGATVVDRPGSRNDLVIDCGNESDVRSTVAPFLQTRGWNRVGGIVLTHGDVRRVGGHGALTGEFPLGETVVSPVPSRSTVYRRIVAELPAGSIRSLAGGDRFGDWRVLHPARGDRFPRGDDNALVLLGEIEGFRILLLSDLGAEGQRALFDRHADLRADVVVAGLPDSGELLKNGLLAAIRPRLIIVTDAGNPASGRPGPELRARLAEQDAEVIWLSEGGSVELELLNGKAAVKTMAGLRLELAAE